MRALVEVDATRYRHPGPLHIVVCEALERALEKEPQVAITLNLAPQLATGGILLPERIHVEACLADVHAELGLEGHPRRPRRQLGTVRDLTAESARRFAGPAGRASGDKAG